AQRRPRAGRWRPRAPGLRRPGAGRRPPGHGQGGDPAARLARRRRGGHDQWKVLACAPKRARTDGRVSETERFSESIKELLGGGRDERLVGLLEHAHAADISSVLPELEPPDQVRLFRLLSSAHAGEVLSELDDPTQRALLRALDEQEVSRVLDQMPADDVVEVVEELPKEEAEKILDLMAEEKSEEVQELLEYREGTAGRLMSP